MRVLFQLLDSGIGGGQLVAARVAEELLRRGHEVGLLVPTSGPASERFALSGAAVSTVDLRSLRRPKAVATAAAILREYDVLYTHTSMPGVILGAEAARRAHRPLVVHQHAFPYFSAGRLVSFGQRLLLRRALAGAAVIAVADHVRDGLVSAGGAPRRLVVVPNAVPEEARTRPPASPGGPVTVGMLGRLDPGKNVHTFVEASTLASLGDACRYVIGTTSGPFVEYEFEIRAAAARAGVEIVEPGSDGTGFLRELDVVVLPSVAEGSPLVLLEAMMLGRAVIASDIPGVREMLEPEGAGMLVPPGDAVSLAAAIRELATDSGRRDALADKAVAVVSVRYRLASMLDSVCDVLESEICG